MRILQNEGPSLIRTLLAFLSKIIVFQWNGAISFQQ